MQKTGLGKKKTMRLRIILGFIGSLAVVFISAPISVSQTAASYRFLQVIDSTGSPIPGAQGQTSGDGVGKSVLSDVLGKLKLQIWYGDFNTRGFSVSKEGYYSYEDLGLINGIFSDSIYGNGTEGSQRLVLLKIPKQPRRDDPDYLEQSKREFFFAAKKGDASAVRQLLKAGLDPNMRTSQLRGIPFPPDVPVIVFAAASGSAATVAALLDAGANLDPTDGYGTKALVYYLQASIPISASNATGIQIAEAKRIYEDVALRLIERGADITPRGYGGSATLILAAARGLNRTVETLIKKGVPIDAKGDYRTALYAAIESNQLDVVRLLLKRGADPNFIPDWGGHNCLTALTLAAGKDDPAYIRALLDNKVNVNFACLNGETALTQSIASGSYKWVKLLLDAGADVSGKQGELALKHAKRRQEWDSKVMPIIDMLRAAGARDSDTP